MLDLSFIVFSGGPVLVGRPSFKHTRARTACKHLTAPRVPSCLGTHEREER